MNLLIINGPNLNMLGTREPEIYGSMTYAQLEEFIIKEGKKLDINAHVFQSNYEGAIVEEIQKAMGKYDGVVINPAAYTHTSVAILDALKAVNLPAAEVHISDVTKREDFRQISYAGMACDWHFIGEGKDGYVNAMKAIKENLE